ncbi:glycosyltransferase 87 family protein [Mangrovivirga sp. M17]|uniref:Glycosyltransferase 87 family protein n=1 Tax=Mangrovivirga halotolerans TaxID=2993936 RepID=A0ABT3RV47_9BACT|nr:glycosyltransferase 87 family protein [Mangrovivirga halotolerans]MCX2745117.1 glycosyltransferase 87 family protein [Mangrovivirga halotolerans]
MNSGYRPVNTKNILGAILLISGIIVQGLFINRNNDFGLLITYFLAFAGYLTMVINSSNHGFKIGIAIFIRIILIFIVPWLSEDIYRFIWDGALWREGIHPFSATPREVMDRFILPENLQQLYNELNSKQYHTIYPPVYQAIGYLSSFLLPFSIVAPLIFIKSVLVAAELTILKIGRRLKKHTPNISQWLTIYLLNPLVIIEGAGNAHFEIMLVPVLIFLAYYVHKKKYMLAGIALGVSVAIKLLPLIFGPFLLFTSVRDKKLIPFLLGSVLTTLILFSPLYSASFVGGIIESTTLYFQKFEFNASIYYLLREVGYMIKGYNTIQTLGPYLSIITTSVLLGISWFYRKKEASKLFFWLWAIYLVFSTTVHPWYVIPLIGLSVINNYKSGIIWSFFIFFTYLGYYENGYIESSLILFLEYSAVFISFLFDLNWVKFKNNPLIK